MEFPSEISKITMFQDKQIISNGMATPPLTPSTLRKNKMHIKDKFTKAERMASHLENQIEQVRRKLTKAKIEKFKSFLEAWIEKLREFQIQPIGYQHFSNSSGEPSHFSGELSTLNVDHEDAAKAEPQKTSEPSKTPSPPKEERSESATEPKSDSAESKDKSFSESSSSKKSKEESANLKRKKEEIQAKKSEIKARRKEKEEERREERIKIAEEIKELNGKIKHLTEAVEQLEVKLDEYIEKHSGDEDFDPSPIRDKLERKKLELENLKYQKEIKKIQLDSLKDTPISDDEISIDNIDSYIAKEKEEKEKISSTTQNAIDVLEENLDITEKSFGGDSSLADTDFAHKSEANAENLEAVKLLNQFKRAVEDAKIKVGIKKEEAQA